MATPAPPGSGKQQAEGQQPPSPTTLAGRALDDAICMMCQEYLTDPVTIECGHNFCRGCITQRCARAEMASCPRCGERCQEGAFRPNMQLRSLVQFIKHLGLKPGQSGGRGDICTEHGKALGWFCKEDGKALCADCRGSMAHRAHTLVPMGRAAQEPKGEASPSHRSNSGTAQALEAISIQQQEPRAMGSAHPLRQILEEVICPICLGYFKDPVSTDCGHHFCRVCITQHYEKQAVEREGVLCPQCRKNIKKENFQTNRQLAIMVEKIQQLGLTPKDVKKQTVCRQHENKLKLFCEDDGEVICLVCDETQEHRSHTLMPVEKAAQEYKVKLQEDMELLKKAREEISKLESMEQNKPKDWGEKVKCQRQQILSEFEKLQLLQEEKKKLLLQRLDEEERETLQRLQENVTKLSQQSTSLQQLIIETEKKYQQPATELLQDVKGTLARSEQARRQKPELSAAELKVAYRVPGMLEMLKEFTGDGMLTENSKKSLQQDGPEQMAPCGMLLERSEEHVSQILEQGETCKSQHSPQRKQGYHPGEGEGEVEGEGNSSQRSTGEKRNTETVQQEIPHQQTPCACSDCATLIKYERAHTRKKPLKCSYCGKCFSQISNLGRHKRIHTEEKPFSCSDCGKSFKKRSDLVKHERTHTGEKPFSCPDCGKSFGQKSYLVSHRRIHTGEKPFSCSDCGKHFSWRSQLVRHKRAHTGEKPFSCSDCGKCFSQRSHLVRHRRAHTGEKPFSCSDCGKSFSERPLPVKRKRIHTGEKPFSCSDCGKCFSQKSYIFIHKKTHTRKKFFSCSDCGKWFSRRSHLVTHRRAHTGEKPFSCPDCKKCFKQRSHLVVHRRTHTGEKPFTCPKCGKCFSRHSLLINHQIIHT